MIERFIEEYFERDAKSYVTAKELHEKYLEFAKDNDLEWISQSTLSKRLNSKLIGATRKKTIEGRLTPVRYGVKLK